MSAMIREFLQITKESAYGTIMTSPTRGTDQIVIRLPGANQFTPRPTPVTIDLPYGGGFNVTSDSVSDKTEIKGSLTTPMTYSQAALLLGWGLERISGTGGSMVPWTTTEPASQFASCTVDHAIWRDDTGDYKRTRYTGMKVDTGKIEVSDESQYATLTLDLIGQLYQGNTFDSSADPTATVFPVPGDSEFALDYVLWIHSSGGLMLGSTTQARAEYTSLAINWNHKHDVRYYATRWVQAQRSFGSDFSIDSDLTLVSTPDDRATFQTLGALAASVAFTNGAHTLTFQYNGNNRIKSLGDDLPLEKIYGRKFSLMNRYDRTAGGWFGFTFA